MRCAVWIIGQVVLTFDSAAEGGETHLVTVVGGCSIVIGDTKRIVFWLAGVPTISKSVHAAVDVVGGAFDGFLHEIRVQLVCLVVEVVVDGVFGFALAGHAVFLGTVPRPVCGAVGTVLESLVSGVEVAPAVVEHIEVNPHRSSYFPHHLSHSNGSF